MQKRTLGLILAIIVIGGLVLAIERPWEGPASSAPPAPSNLPASEAKFDAAADFGGATSWVNSAPIDLVQLRGKVVLVDFWTYSCINCIRTFPHVEGNYERYQKDGLVVIGVHTPEFAFERDVKNIKDAATRYHLTYPIAVDSDYGIWNAYGNRYWPADYLIDQYGRVRHTHFGEGDYVETELLIRQLLTEAGHPPSVPPGESDSPSAPAIRITPELYVGSGRSAVANQASAQKGDVGFFERPSMIAADRITLVGNWTIREQNASAGPEDASTLVRFRAGAANAVLDGPRGACVRVLLDGAPIPMALAGRDVQTFNGLPCLILDGPRSYDWFAGHPDEHVVELVFPPGGTLFTFDFSQA